ncbi:MAG: permease [Halanaerobiales bacterium]|nr:permease [Halanaerobiales bacterium]
MDVGNIYLLLAAVLLIISGIKNIDKTKKSVLASFKIALNIIPVLFFIFVLMGFMQVFISKELIVSWLGSSSSFISIIIGELVGSFALIQPAAVFPFAGFLQTSGANYGAILGFVMSAILIGVATIALEVKLFGKKFTITRNLLTFSFIFILGSIFRLVL